MTPKARFAALIQLAWGVNPAPPCPPCACTSTIPGMMNRPAQSITVAPAGAFTASAAPTATMRLFSITTVPFWITSSPRMVISVAFVSAIVAPGASKGCEKPMWTPCSGGGGSSAGASAPASHLKVSSSLRE